jgi:Protein metal binding site.
MIIWGGGDFGQFNFRTTGGRYNPSTDTWTGITTTGAPGPRQGASAVWTGIEMVVWGGTYFGDERTGGRLLLDVRSDVDEDQDGYSFCGGDCNDANPAVHPGAVETCNQIDDNCAVAVDDGFDQDGDSFTSCTGDCNDADPAIHVAVTEVCNGLDENCNFEIDEGFVDGDGDDHAVCVDCNDSNSNVWAVPVEVTNLTLVSGSPTEVYWDSVSIQAGDPHYDLASGMLTGSGALDAGTCLRSANGLDVYDNRPDPGPGTGYWYLARGRNSCGIGTYGFASNNVERSIPACP